MRAVTATGDGSFSARFPLEVTDVPVVVDVVAHLAAPSPGCWTIPAEKRLAVEVVGPIGLLPLAYDALLDAGRVLSLPLGDVVVEHYLDLGAVGRTEVAIPVRDAAWSGPQERGGRRSRSDITCHTAAASGWAWKSRLGAGR